MFVLTSEFVGVSADPVRILETSARYAHPRSMLLICTSPAVEAVLAGVGDVQRMLNGTVICTPPFHCTGRRQRRVVLEHVEVGRRTRRAADPRSCNVP